MSNQCVEYDMAFRDSEQQISKDIVKKKWKLDRNAYWGRVPDAGLFPLKSGTSIKKIRLTRIGLAQEMLYGWEQVSDSGTSTDMCAEPQADVIDHGSQESFYTLERFKLSTQPICLAMLPFRQMADEEVAHLEQHIHMMAQYHWDEYLRTRWTHLAEHKVIALVDAADMSGDTCDMLAAKCDPAINTSNGFMFLRRDPNNPSGPPVIASTGSIDERYLLVNVDPANIYRIAELSGDLLETAAIQMQYEDENKQFLDQGIGFYDTVVPDVRMARRLTQLERIQESLCLPAVIYNGADLTRKLGYKAVIRDSFGLRFDAYGLKYYPDQTYNAGLEAYDDEDPTTWPRFKRVWPYKAAKNVNGTGRQDVNPDFARAPFGITNLFTPTVMKIRHYPTAMSTGSAVKGDLARTYGGEAKWVNEYDKICNPNKEIGHWDLHFGAAIEPDRPENGWSFFHRIDLRVSLVGQPCDVPNLGCQEPQGGGNYVFRSIQTGEAALGATLGGYGANPLDKTRNGNVLFW